MSVPVHVLSGGDGEGVSIVARPQQHVASLGLPLEQEHRLQTGNIVVTPGRNHVTQNRFRGLLEAKMYLSAGLRVEHGYSRRQVRLGADVRVGAGCGRRRIRVHPLFFLLNNLFQHVDLTWEQVEGGRYGQLRDGGGATCSV